MVRISTRRRASPGITLSWAAPLAGAWMTVGVKLGQPRCASQPREQAADSSRRCRPWIRAATAGAVFKPDSGMAPWLIRPPTVSRARREPFWLRADHPVLGLADDRRRDGIGVAALDKMPHAEHLVLLVAQDAADDGAGKPDPAALEGGHGREHGGEVALGVVGPPAVHAPAHDRGAEGVMGPGGHIPGGDHVRVALEHEGAGTAAGRVRHDHVGPPGGDRLHRDRKALRLGPGRRVLGRRLLARPGPRVPDGIYFNKRGRQVDDFFGIHGLQYFFYYVLAYHFHCGLMAPYRILTIFGSSVSRRPSPNRLNPSTAQAIASPGKIAIQGAVDM